MTSQAKGTAHARSTGPAAVPLPRSAPSPAAAAPADRTALRLGTAAGVAGVVVQVVMDRLHPHRVQPNDSVHAFQEYAASGSWTAVHLGQLVGTLLVTLSLLALARALAGAPGLPGALASAAAVTAVVAAAVFAVQMAVDGVALRDAVDTWVDASPGPLKSSAFQVADGLRGLEKGLSAVVHLSSGFTLLALGPAVVLGRTYARWLGWTATAAGAAFVTGGALTAATGFSTATGLVLLPAAVLLAVFLLAMCAVVWRRPSTA